MYDLILKNGKILDGSGNPWYKADIAITSGKISSIGKISSSGETVLNVDGLIVAPGFIDTHSHSDLILIAEPEAQHKVMQGITTEIVGQDGLGEAPIRNDLIKDWRKYLSGLNGDPEICWSWNSLGDYLKVLENVKTSINVASLVGHGNLRVLVIGMKNRRPTRFELDEMKELLKKSILEGALG